MILDVGLGPARSEAFRPPLRRSDRHRYHQQYLADTKNPYGYCPDHGTATTGLRPLVWSVSGGATGLRPLVKV